VPFPFGCTAYIRYKSSLHVVHTISVLPHELTEVKRNFTRYLCLRDVYYNTIHLQDGSSGETSKVIVRENVCVLLLRYIVLRHDEDEILGAACPPDAGHQLDMGVYGYIFLVW